VTAGRNRQHKRIQLRVPRPRWLLTTALLAVFAFILIIEAYASGRFVPDAIHDTGSGTRVPASVVNGGPVIDTTGGRPRSYHLPPRTIALTFDDGPDPAWTPKILAVLRRHRVHATFFVVGSNLSRHPGNGRSLVADGNEIGSHTFSHPDLAEVPAWQRSVEYVEVQSAISGATGMKTSLLRYPYSSSAEAIDNAYWPIVQEVGRRGYLTVLTDNDSEDWTRPGVDAIVRNATPGGDHGSIVLMHDAGGDRTQTVAALDRFIPLMQARGYRFMTVSEGVGLAVGTGPVANNTPAGALDVWRGRGLVAAVQIADSALRVLAILFILVGVLTLGRTTLLFVLAGRHAHRRRSSTWSWGPPVTEPVSVVVPAYNEREGIEAAVRSLATGDYPGDIEVVVIDDGSTDGTADLVEALGLANVHAVRVPNGGKPSALNVGIARARHELIIMVDGDTIFEPDSIRQLVAAFADERVGAVAGNVKVGNRGSVVARWQHIEYVIGFNLDRRLYDTLRCMPTVPGAIGAFRRAALRDVGGVSDDTLAEDTDLAMAICRAGWHIVYAERARAWTEAPSTLGQLWKQRYRWSYGTMQAMWKHRRALIQRGGSGRLGRRGLLSLALFSVALPMLAPLLDIMSVYGFFFFDRGTTAVAWTAMLALQTVTAVAAFRMDRESLRPLWALALAQFVYRQMMYLVVIQSVITALTGARLRWHKLHRTGQPEVPVTGRSREPA
jgi:cellulose synthase/poly-beta-1,6-N-acetylglucosamine synthase-like glycosyltransferase/peptidoglycan/xylan/chitin deacetylase (PgdA/CDA1 family)